jgi:hypothetical protein
MNAFNPLNVPCAFLIQMILYPRPVARFATLFPAEPLHCPERYIFIPQTDFVRRQGRAFCPDAAGTRLHHMENMPKKVYRINIRSIYFPYR